MNKKKYHLPPTPLAATLPTPVRSGREREREGRGGPHSRRRLLWPPPLPSPLRLDLGGRGGEGTVPSSAMCRGRRCCSSPRPIGSGREGTTPPPLPPSLPFSTQMWNWKRGRGGDCAASATACSGRRRCRSPSLAIYGRLGGRAGERCLRRCLRCSLRSRALPSFGRMVEGEVMMGEVSEGEVGE